MADSRGGHQPTTATLALRWINHELPPGTDALRAITLTLASAVVVLLSITTVRAIDRGEFLPRQSH